MPPTRNRLIVVNKSIGPIVLGESAIRAKHNWPGGACSYSSCEWKISSNTTTQFAAIVFSPLYAFPIAGPVDQVEIQTIGSPGVLNRFKTSQGIGLGSTLRQLCKAFPGIYLSYPNIYSAILYTGKVTAGYATGRGTQFGLGTGKSPGNRKIVDIAVADRPYVAGPYKRVCGLVH